MPKLIFNKIIMNYLEKQKNKGLTILCEDHPDLVAEFYCKKDEVFLCYKCALLTHQGHEIKDAKEIHVDPEV